VRGRSPDPCVTLPHDGNDHPMNTTRRDFVTLLAGATGALVLLPVACTTTSSSSTASSSTASSSTASSSTASSPPAPPATPDPLALPLVPDAFDALAFNRARGNAGAIPDSYRAAINAADGDQNALGKHLPYVPSLAAGVVPAGMLALMWGDPAKGYAAHPNAAPTPEVPSGHWYNWIRVRKATAGDAVEREAKFSAWPAPASGDDGQYAAASGSDVTADKGKGTVYLVPLPPDVKPGDVVRIHAHCLTHGEYVDFVAVPA
jgi:hypothetical protein